MARKQCLEAERERDIAIEEAAIAYYELSLLRREVETLRREKDAWEAGQDAWSQRHEQLLSHVGAMGEMLWCAFAQSLDGDTRLSVEDAKLLALETFAQVVPKSDAQVYEEMHELYAKIAHMEAQQTTLAEKLRELKRINDDLKQKLRLCEEATTVALQVEEDKSDKTDCARPAEALAVIHPTPEHEQSGFAVPPNTSETDAPAIALLQAQLAMYINSSKRHRPNGPTPIVLENRRTDH